MAANARAAQTAKEILISAVSSGSYRISKETGEALGEMYLAIYRKILEIEDGESRENYSR